MSSRDGAWHSTSDRYEARPDEPQPRKPQPHGRSSLWLGTRGPVNSLGLPHPTPAPPTPGPQGHPTARPVTPMPLPLITPRARRSLRRPPDAPHWPVNPPGWPVPTRPWPWTLSGLRAKPVRSLHLSLAIHLSEAPCSQGHPTPHRDYRKHTLSCRFLSLPKPASRPQGLCMHRSYGRNLFSACTSILGPPPPHLWFLTGCPALLC